MSFRVSYYLAILVGFLSTLGCCESLENWPEISPALDIMIRTQRDVQLGTPINQINGFGISLNQILIQNGDGHSKIISNLNSLLATKPTVIMVDLYWDEQNSWLFCQEPKNTAQGVYNLTSVGALPTSKLCSSPVNISDIIGTMRSYFVDSDKDVDTNFIQILLNLKPLFPDFGTWGGSHSEKSTYMGSKAMNALYSEITPIQNFLFTPPQLESWSSSGNPGLISFYNNSEDVYPSLQNMLFTTNKRVMIIALYDISKAQQTPQIKNNEDDWMVFLEHTINIDVTNSSMVNFRDKCGSLVHKDDTNSSVFNELSKSGAFRYVIDGTGAEFSTDTYSDWIRCGYTPVLNASAYYSKGDSSYGSKNSSLDTIGKITDHFILFSFWSWVQSAVKENDFVFKISGVSQSKNTQVAYNCIVFNSSWALANCYSVYSFACQNASDPNKWHVDPDRKGNYFSSATGSVCPEGYNFKAPASATENLALQDELTSLNITKPLWIDLNDITVGGCFVNGGPYAKCPYQDTATSRRLVQLIAPSAVVSGLIIVAVFIEKCFRVNPIQTNRRRYWRKTINEYKKLHEYEGVPS